MLNNRHTIRHYFILISIEIRLIHEKNSGKILQANFKINCVRRGKMLRSLLFIHQEEKDKTKLEKKI